MWAVRSMKIKTSSLKTKIRTLSGGNQQKVILGRWLLTKPEILLSTSRREASMGAKYEIYQLIIDLAASGKKRYYGIFRNAGAARVCDRILVMSGGRAAGSFRDEQRRKK